MEKSKKKDDKYNAGAVDAGITAKLEKIIESLRSNEGNSDYTHLLQFFQRGQSNQLVQTWSYYAQINNHAMFAKTTMLILHTLRLLGKNATATEWGSALIKLILMDYIKVIYRGLNNVRSQITNPILYLMKEIILFNQSQHVEDFLSFFDFSLTSLPRIMTPSKSELENIGKGNVSGNKHKSLRLSFIEFWIVLITKTPSLLRKDLLIDNFKIMSAWFKYMDKTDSPKTMIDTLNMFIVSILQERMFKRLSKTKILNEFALAKIHHFYYSNDKDLVKKVNEFFIAYGVTPSSSVAFPDNCVWFSESPVSGNNSGVEIVVNQREFKIYNKLLFNVIRLFKPWEDEMQSTTVLKYLEHTPELVAPYCYNLASLGAHDPRMTSYWFGMTMLLGRIINLPIPEFMKNIESDLVPSTSIVMENILPSSLTKSASTKMLQNDVILIKHLGCQLLIFAFQKLKKILDLYDRKGWSSSKASLNTTFLNDIPDLSVIVATMNQTYQKDKENKLIALSLAMILKHYSIMFSNFFSITFPPTNVFVDILQKNSFNGVELALLDNFLQFQEFNGTQTKWWNSTNTENSLLSSLLKLASSNNSNYATTKKVCDLINNLLKGSVIFNDDLLIDPITTLVVSLQVHFSKSDDTPQTFDRVWTLLDQCIARVIKTPYKYVDMAQNYDNISPFLMTLSEQWKFVEKTDAAFDQLAKWVCIFFRILAITGESQVGLKRLLNERFENIPDGYVAVYLNFDNSDVVALNRADYILNELVDSSFFHYINLVDYKKIKNNTRLPVNDLDALAILFKITLIAEDQEIKLDNNFKTNVLTLLEVFAKYVLTNNSLTLIAPKIYEPLFLSISNNSNNDLKRKKFVYITQQLLSIFEMSSDKENIIFEKFLYHWLIDFLNQNKELDQIESVLSATVCHFLNIADVRLILFKNTHLDEASVIEIFSKLAKHEDVMLDFGTIMKYFSSNPKIVTLVSKFIADNRFEKIDSSSLLDLIVEDISYISLLHAFATSQYFDVLKILPYLSKTKSKSIEMSIASIVNNLADGNKEVKEFIEKVILYCGENFKDFSHTEFETFLAVFINNAKLVNDDQARAVLQYITTEYEHKFSYLVIDFVANFSQMQEEFISKWFNKMTLYITKIFSDKCTLSEKFTQVLKSFKELVDTHNIWTNVSASIINTQLEVVLSKTWINDSFVMEYILSIVMKASDKQVQANKMVQIMINNEDSSFLKDCETESYIKYLSTLVLYVLFSIDPASCSNRLVQNKLVTFYTGTISSTDKLIFQMLQIIESNYSESWTNLIYTWDLVESDSGLDIIGEVKLFTQEKEGLILTLRRDIIENSMKNYVIDRSKVPQVKFDDHNAFTKFQDFFRESERILVKEKRGIVYDPLFLLLLTINNKELVKQYKSEEENDKRYVFNVKNFILSKLFQFVICCLGDKDTETKRVAEIILTQILISLEDEMHQFKDSNIYKILVKKILFTINSHKDQTPIIPMMWFSIGSLCEILNQPVNVLYEKAFRWILNGPQIRYFDIPLLQELLSPKATDYENDSFYAQLSWILRTLETSTTCKEDVELLKRQNVIEWLYALTNVPYLNGRLLSNINYNIYKIQRIEDGGSNLVTRFGGISQLQLQEMSVMKHSKELETLMKKNDKNTYRLKKKLLLEELRLNQDQIGRSYEVLVQSNKRLSDWTEDFANVKRQCK